MFSLRVPSIPTVQQYSAKPWKILHSALFFQGQRSRGDHCRPLPRPGTGQNSKSHFRSRTSPRQCGCQRSKLSANSARKPHTLGPIGSDVNGTNALGLPRPGGFRECARLASRDNVVGRKLWIEVSLRVADDPAKTRFFSPPDVPDFYSRCCCRSMTVGSKHFGMITVLSGEAALTSSANSFTSFIIESC